MKKEKDTVKFKAYKVFNSDWTCKNYNFKTNNGSAINSIHKIKNSNLELCSSGFHFCRNLNMCFSYYNFDSNNHIAEIEVLGNFTGDVEDKECTDKFRIIRELSWEEVLRIVNIGKCNSGHSNSGDGNSGDGNSGYKNSGYRNSGDGNSGYRNSGDGNSGNWNSCSNESGFFNSSQSNIIRIFNKNCDREVFEKCIKPNFIYFDLTEWISFEKMSDEEKIKYPKAHVCNGYLKIYSYKEAWARAYNCATKEDIKLLKDFLWN